MVKHCYVADCKSDSRYHEDVKFFKLPGIVSENDRRYMGFGKEKKHQELIELSKKRQNCWISALRRGQLIDSQNQNLHVCGKHFLSGKPAKLEDEDHPDWVPNSALGYKVGVAIKRKSSLERYDRHAKRAKLKKPTVDVVDNLPDVAPDLDILMNLTPEYLPSNCKQTQTDSTIDNCKQTQTDLTIDDITELMQKLTVTIKDNETLRQKLCRLDLTPEFFENDNEKTRYFTGLTNFKTLLLIHNIIAPKLYNRSNTSLSTFQQLLLTLIKLRLNLPFKFLSFRFGVALSTVSRYFRRCLHVLYCTFSGLIHWPDRPTLQSTMPACFRECFGTSTTTIIDCFEIFMESPSNLCSSAQCWSNYKHHKTVKNLIACSPQGSVMFISDSYGGRASDDFITQDSGFLNHITPGDVVLADRGFQIEEVLSLHGSKMKIPAFTKGKKQLHPVELEDTRQIANVRIHIERVIGALRQIFTILSGTIPISLLCTQNNGISVFDEILAVCCLLFNLRPSVVNPE